MSNTTVRDEVLEEAAEIVEQATSWGLTDAQKGVVRSFQDFAAKAIRAQKSDSPERASHESKAAA